MTAPAWDTGSLSVFPEAKETLQSGKWGWGKGPVRPPLRPPLPRDSRPAAPLTSPRAPAGGRGVPATHRAARPRGSRAPDLTAAAGPGGGDPDGGGAGNQGQP